jgi:hypothetical protein
MPYNSSDPNSSGSDIGAPLTGWTTSIPSSTFAPTGGIGGDWRFPSLQVDPRILPPPGQARMAMPARPVTPTPPVNPFRPPAVPVGQVAQTPQPGNANLWDALRALFSGQPSAQGQGMSGMLQPRGQAGPSTDALGNPFNRFG